jgi:hypothetical protein
MSEDNGIAVVPIRHVFFQDKQFIYQRRSEAAPFFM